MPPCWLPFRTKKKRPDSPQEEIIAFQERRVVQVATSRLLHSEMRGVPVFELLGQRVVECSKDCRQKQFVRSTELRQRESNWLGAHVAKLRRNEMVEDFKKAQSKVGRSMLL